MALSRSRDRGEADRARAILLTLSGWTSGQIAEAFGVREDTVRFWRSAFMTGGIEALKTSVAPGPAPVKAERALAVAEEVLSGPVADRPNWTLPRLADEIETRAGVRISRSRLSVVLRKKGAFRWRRPRHTLKGRQDADAVDRAGLRRKLLKAQAEAGDIVLLFGDESEALTHPYLAHVWAKKGADLRIPAPGQSAKVAMLGVLDWARRELIVQHQPNQAKLRLHRSPGGDRPALWSQARRRDPAPRARPRQRPDPHQQGDPCRPRRAGSLAQGRVAAEIRSGAERYRGSSGAT